MADFARFAVAAEPALGLPPGSFLRVYSGNQQEAHEAVLESSPVATAVQRFMADRVDWKGNATELLAELEDLMDERTLKSKAWAGNSSSLGKALARLAPALRGVGINIEPDRKARKRFYRIERMAHPVSLPSSLSQGNQQQVSSNDSSLPSTVMEPMAPVISVNAVDQALQPSDDTHDSCDTKVQPSSSLVGKTVRKQGKQGWRGVVQTVEGDLATVLWHADEWPSTVMLAELEVIA